MLGLLSALRERRLSAEFHRGAAEDTSVPQKVMFVWACRNAGEFDVIDEQLLAEARWDTPSYVLLAAANADFCCVTLLHEAESVFQLHALKLCVGFAVAVTAVLLHFVGDLQQASSLPRSTIQTLPCCSLTPESS